ncbi:sodium:proton antiporter [filamentous cyanobacterium CCP5]|nr:sodium:proton antiporter [filamentous cyanobacterium CCP5]
MPEVLATEDLYILAIAALLPLTAAMTVTQRNPYHALVIRGILGAVAALVYALFGAADVALTEALVGTMLSITLYAIAVRSSMSMRLGVLESVRSQEDYEAVKISLRDRLRQQHMRLEEVPYSSPTALYLAIEAKDVHAICNLEGDRYHVQTRIPRLFKLLQTAVPDHAALVLCRSEMNQSLTPRGQGDAGTRGLG